MKFAYYRKIESVSTHIKNNGEEVLYTVCIKLRGKKQVKRTAFTDYAASQQYCREVWQNDIVL